MGGNGDWEAAHSQPEYVTPRAQNGGKYVNDETVKNGGKHVNTTTENGGKQGTHCS